MRVFGRHFEIKILNSSQLEHLELEIVILDGFGPLRG